MFSAEYKAETVQLIQRSGKSIGQMALELGIGDTALRRWVAQAEIEAGRGPAGALKLLDAARAASPAGRETETAVSLKSALGAMAVRFLVTSRNFTLRR